MGKAKKNKGRHSYQYNPLNQNTLENNVSKDSVRTKIPKKYPKDDKFVDNKYTNENLEEARQQQDDLEEDIGFSYSNLAPVSSSSDELKTEDDVSSLSSISVKERECEITNRNVSEEDEKSSKKFIGNLFKHQNSSFTEEQSDTACIEEDPEPEKVLEIDDNEMKDLVKVLHEYRSGKLPKLFKIIPTFSNWEKLLLLTEPDKWSAATMYQATRIFSSNISAKMLLWFCRSILCPRLRYDLAKYKKLNIGLIKALGKATHKPAAFFKGIIIPLCEAKDFTVNEARIIGSVMTKCSLSVLHSSAALLTFAEMEYSDVTSIFMGILIEKNYPLSSRVINALVDYFLRFKEENSQYPLLWHKCLLAFVKIYKIDFSAEQKANLLNLLTVQRHEKVTPEIQKELESKPDVEEIMQFLWKM